MSWTPPTIPKRQAGWETAYVATMERQLALPFGWDPKAHCLGTPAELCLAMTGVDPMQGVRRYSTEAGAWQQLFKLGFSDVEDALKAVFPEVGKLLARRGDCGILRQDTGGKTTISTFIVMGEMAAGRSDRGNVFIPVSALSRTFAIGAL